jgi:acetyltransferase-like isoleucine patch superfamily enzyme
MTTLFDILFWIVWLLVHAVAAAAALAVGDALWGPHLVQKAGAIAIGYLVFIHAFVLAAGGLRFLVQPRLKEGLTPIGLNREFVAWGIQSVFQGVFTTSIFARQIHILFYLRWLYYRLMGMKLSLSTLIGTQATIRQAELIELGPKSIVGEGSYLVPHLSPDGKNHMHGRIRLGERSVIGGRASVAPGATMGDRSVLGACSVLGMNAQVGDEVRIGPNVLIMPNVVIGHGAKIVAGSVVRQNTVIEAGEVWGGNPAVRLR